jgi:hypothetical protein
LFSVVSSFALSVKHSSTASDYLAQHKIAIVGGAYLVGAGGKNFFYFSASHVTSTAQ